MEQRHQRARERGERKITGNSASRSLQLSGLHAANARFPFPGENGGGGCIETEVATKTNLASEYGVERKNGEGEKGGGVYGVFDATRGLRGLCSRACALPANCHIAIIHSSLRAGRGTTSFPAASCLRPASNGVLYSRSACPVSLSSVGMCGRSWFVTASGSYLASMLLVGGVCPSDWGQAGRQRRISQEKGVVFLTIPHWCNGRTYGCVTAYGVTCISDDFWVRALLNTKTCFSPLMYLAVSVFPGPAGPGGDVLELRDPLVWVARFSTPGVKQDPTYSCSRPSIVDC